MEKNNLTFLPEQSLYIPTMFFGKDYERKNGGKAPFPNIREVVGQVVDEFPDFAEKDHNFALYRCMHTNGFASTTAGVWKKISVPGGLQEIRGSVCTDYSNCDVSKEKYMPQFKENMDKAGLVHLDIKPDTLGLNYTLDLNLGDSSKVLSSMRIDNDYGFSLITIPGICFTNTAYVQGPKRDFSKTEKIKKDALSVAAITQALNETFTEDFLRLEEPRDDGQDISDFCP
jgi:hypothetical protein